MKSLNELIGQEVYVKQYVYDEEIDIEKTVFVKAKVTEVNINDFYFENRKECVYIYVNLGPMEDLDKYGLDEDCLIDVPLDCIYKSN